jgi:Ca-activated chloride channel family protein
MTTTTLARLESVDGAEITLESIDVQTNLQGLVSGVTVTQTYRNLQDTNIEAVYIFPLPSDAVLSDLSLEQNGKTLRGTVKRADNAEEHYEDTMIGGDSAVLLKKSKLDLFTMNVGNLLPNERVTIQFKYAQLHYWQGDSVRFHLPTTIAPRYGNPRAAGLVEHEVPEYWICETTEYTNLTCVPR